LPISEPFPCRIVRWGDKVAPNCGVQENDNISAVRQATANVLAVLDCTLGAWSNVFLSTFDKVLPFFAGLMKCCSTPHDGPFK
jgi:hypothetical protein